MAGNATVGCTAPPVEAAVVTAASSATRARGVCHTGVAIASGAWQVDVATEGVLRPPPATAVAGRIDVVDLTCRPLLLLLLPPLLLLLLLLRARGAKRSCDCESRNNLQKNENRNKSEHA